MKETESDFNFFVPIEFEKGTTKKGEKVMKIKGIASTKDKDSEDEELDPIGFDLSRFMSTGFINWNHQSKTMGAKAIIGEPTVAKVTPEGLYVEGTLYNGSDLAESVYKLAETLEKNGSNRRLGFSIEGKALERNIANPKKISRALVTGLAVTHVPINTNTYLDLVKGVQKEDFIEIDEKDPLEVSKEQKYIYEFMSGDKRFGITKSFEVESIDKSMDIAATRPIIPESLDKKPKVLEPVIRKAILKGWIPARLICAHLK